MRTETAGRSIRVLRGACASQAHAFFELRLGAGRSLVRDDRPRPGPLGCDAGPLRTNPRPAGHGPCRIHRGETLGSGLVLGEPRYHRAHDRYDGFPRASTPISHTTASSVAPSSGRWRAPLPSFSSSDVGPCSFPTCQTLAVRGSGPSARPPSLSFRRRSAPRRLRARADHPAARDRRRRRHHRHRPQKPATPPGGEPSRARC